MANWERGAKIEGAHLSSLPDDTIVWVDWTVSGYGEPVLMESIRQLGDPVGSFCTVYNLSVFPASLDAHLAQENDKRRWDSIFD